MKIIRILIDINKEQNESLDLVQEYSETKGLKLFGITFIKPTKIRNPYYDFIKAMRKYQPNLRYKLEVDNYQECMRVMNKNILFFNSSFSEKNFIEQIDLEYYDEFFDEHLIFKNALIESVEPVENANHAIITARVDNLEKKK